MADVTSIPATRTSANVIFDRPALTRATPASLESTDSVEISELAQLLSSLDPDQQTGIRAQKVADIRAAIANGTYETADKIDYVVSRLMDELEAGPFELDSD